MWSDRQGDIKKHWADSFVTFRSRFCSTSPIISQERPLFDWLLLLNVRPFDQVLEYHRNSAQVCEFRLVERTNGFKHFRQQFFNCFICHFDDFQNWRQRQGSPKPSLIGVHRPVYSWPIGSAFFPLCHSVCNASQDLLSAHAMVANNSRFERHDTTQRERNRKGIVDENITNTRPLNCGGYKDREQHLMDDLVKFSRLIDAGKICDIQQIRNKEEFMSARYELEILSHHWDFFVEAAKKGRAEICAYVATLRHLQTNKMMGADCIARIGTDMYHLKLRDLLKNVCKHISSADTGGFPSVTDSVNLFTTSCKLPLREPGTSRFLVAVDKEQQFATEKVDKLIRENLKQERTTLKQDWTIHGVPYIDKQCFLTTLEVLIDLWQHDDLRKDIARQLLLTLVTNSQRRWETDVDSRAYALGWVGHMVVPAMRMIVLNLGATTDDLLHRMTIPYIDYDAKPRIRCARHSFIVCKSGLEQSVYVRQCAAFLLQHQAEVMCADAFEVLKKLEDEDGHNFVPMSIANLVTDFIAQSKRMKRGSSSTEEEQTENNKRRKLALFYTIQNM